MASEGTSSNGKRNGMPGFAVILLIAGAFIVGMFWNRLTSLERQVDELKGGSKPQAAAGNQAGTGQVNNQPTAADQPQLGSAAQVDPVTETDHLRGNPKADIILIEYSDFQCPFCHQFHPTMQQVMKDYGDKVAWVYRHFPLTQLHPNAQPAAEASECVAELGGNDAFWKYADELFTGTDLSKDGLTTAAVKIGVDKTKFTSCFESGKYTQKVNDLMASGQKAGINGTPGTVILQVSTGKTTLIPGAYPVAQVEQAIDSFL